jgi:poly(A) polymerase
MDVRAHALEIARVLRRAGFETYWAGGCVRDQLMGRAPKDYDIATAARPDQVRSLFPRTVEVGAAFGVIQVLRDQHPFEVATFRRDLEYRDGRHPAGVEFSGAEEDAHRRDFTINGLFYDPIEERVVDYVNGRADLSARVIRTIGRPEDRFGEDYLRMLRAIRFASTLEFAIEPATLAAIQRLARHITAVSMERIQNELTRLLTESPRAGQGLNLLRQSGLLSVILPEVDRMADQAQPPEYHPEGDVFTHTAMMLDALDQPSPALAYATLLHDVGKPPTAQHVRQPDGSIRIRFDKHAQVGAELTESILRRLKLPGPVVEEAAHMVKNHMRFMDVRRMRRSTLRRMVGAPTFTEELELHRVDCLCSHGGLDNYDFLRAFQEELRQEPALPPPWITGHDLMALGLPQGPDVGKWHRLAYDAQLENRFPDRAALLEWLRSAVRQDAGGGAP